MCTDFRVNFLQSIHVSMWSRWLLSRFNLHGLSVVQDGPERLHADFSLFSWVARLGPAPRFSKCLLGHRDSDGKEDSLNFVSWPRHEEVSFAKAVLSVSVRVDEPVGVRLVSVVLVVTYSPVWSCLCILNQNKMFLQQPSGSHGYQDSEL